MGGYDLENIFENKTIPEIITIANQIEQQFQDKLMIESDYLEFRRLLANKAFELDIEFSLL